MTLEMTTDRDFKFALNDRATQILRQKAPSSDGLAFGIDTKKIQFGENNISPYMVNRASKRLLKRAIGNLKDQSVLVFYTVEIASELERMGIQDVTVVTKDYDDNTRRFTEKFLGYKYYTLEEIKEMRKIFDIAIGNPPYKGQSKFHQQMFNEAVDLVKPKTGQVIFIQPANVYVKKTEEIENKSGINHNLKMQYNIKKYKTSVEFVRPNDFFSETIRTGLAITHLLKRESTPNLDTVAYINGETYNNVKLGNINRTQMEPTHYEVIARLYNEFVDTNGSLEDILTSDPKIARFSIASIRGNYSKPNEAENTDWYTFFSNKENKQVVLPAGHVDMSRDGKTPKEQHGIPVNDPNRPNGDPDKNKEAIIHNLKLYSIRFGLSLRKFAVDVTRGGATRQVPLIDFYKKQNDEDVYKLIGITKEQQIEIKKVIPPYYD